MRHPPSREQRRGTIEEYASRTRRSILPIKNSDSEFSRFSVIFFVCLFVCFFAPARKQIRARGSALRGSREIVNVGICMVVRILYSSSFSSATSITRKRVASHGERVAANIYIFVRREALAKNFSKSSVLLVRACARAHRAVPA